MAHAQYPARFQDALGEEQTVIENDGKTLCIELRGVTFEGADFDSLEPTIAPADPQLETFTLHDGCLCGCALECELPIPVVASQDVIPGRLEMRLELGLPREGGHSGIDRETLSLSLSFADQTYRSQGATGFFDFELADIQRALPDSVYFTSCFTCAFSDYSPYGSGLFGSLACFRDNKDTYRQVTDKRDLFAIWDTMTQFVQETWLCPEFERRRSGAGYRG